MIRDVLLQSGPPIAITDWRPPTVLVGCLVVTVVRVEGGCGSGSGRPLTPSPGVPPRRRSDPGAGFGSSR